MKKLVTLSLVILVFFSGCKKEKGDPPILPPGESMTIDFANFEYQTKSAQSSAIKGTENSAWEFAAHVAGLWKSVYRPLNVPVKCFQTVARQKPEFVSEKTWQWSYDVPVSEGTDQGLYKARLVGRIGESNVEWTMYITKKETGGFSDFQWFTGTSAFDGKSGKWTMNHSPEDAVNLIEIDWEKPQISIGKVKYTYVKNGDFKNSFIEYGPRASVTRYNSYYTVNYWEGAKFSDVNVEWNKSTREGRIRCADQFHDNEWHCWDSNWVNGSCPE